MELVEKGRFFRTGLTAALLGLFLTIIAPIALPVSRLQYTYPGDLYWGIIIGLLGVGLIMTGLIVIIMGSLRAD